MLTRNFSKGKQLLFSAVLTVVVHASCMAGDLEKDTSLRLAPVDADIYSASLNMKAQWERFAQSKTCQELLKTPIVQELMEIAKEEWEADEGQLTTARQIIQNPNVISMLEMLKEMMSSEGFMIADKNFSEMSVGITKLQNEMYQSMGGDPQQMIEWLLDLPKSKMDAIPVPMVIAGFKIEDKDRVLMHLDQLEGIVKFGLGSVPQFAPIAESLERVETDRGTRLVMTLSSDMIPWEQIPQNDEQTEELIDKLQELMEERQMVFSIGQLDEYFVFALSDSAEAIENLGEGESLASHPDMQPLKAFESKQVTGIGYVSDHFSDLNFQATLHNYFSKLGRQFLPAIELQFGDEMPEFLESLEEDLAWLDSEIGAHVPEFKGQLGVSFMTEKGQEGVVYNRTKAVVLDGSKKLDVLNHVGGKPLMFWAFRNQNRSEYFKTARRIVQKVKNYLDGLSKSDLMQGDEKEQLEMVLENVWPLLKRVADVWEEKFLPAMADGQHAMVMTQGNLSSKQWAPDMPASDEPLPLPELAGVHGLSDEQLMKAGFVELFEIIDEALATANKLHPNEVPSGIVVPRPEESSVTSGTRYSYPIPDNCPAPKSMAPQAVFKDGFMIMSYSDELSDVLAKNTSLGVGGDRISTNKPMASAAYLDFGGVTAMFRPWIRYAILQSSGDLESKLVPEQGSFPGLCGEDILQVWDCLRFAGSMASMTITNEDGSTTTHWTFVD